MAIDRNQVNALRNDGVFTVANGPFDSKVIGYLKDPGFPKFDVAEAKKLADQYKAANGGQFSVVLEHTNDTANVAEAELIKQQLAAGGHRRDAQAGRPDRSSSPPRSPATSASCCGASTPVTTPTASTSGGPTARCSTSASSPTRRCRACSTRDGCRATRRRARRSTRTSTSEFAEAGLQRVALLLAVDDRRRRRTSRGSKGPPLPDGGGQPLFLYGRHPLLGISVSQ